jgi:hypothetical protein
VSRILIGTWRAAPFFSGISRRRRLVRDLVVAHNNLLSHSCQSMMRTFHSPDAPAPFRVNRSDASWRVRGGQSDGNQDKGQKHSWAL